MDTHPSNLEEPQQAKGQETTRNDAAATAAGAGISNQAETSAEDTAAEDLSTTDAEAQAEEIMTQGEKSVENARQHREITEESLLEAIAAMLAKDPADYSSEDISRLRSHFNILHSNNAVAAEDAAEATDDEAGQEADGTAGNEIEVQPDAQPSLGAQVEAAVAELRRRKSEWTARQEAIRADNLKRKFEIIEQIAALADDTDNVNRTFPRYRELQDEFNTIGEVDPQQETAVWKRFQEVREQYSDNLKINKELRDYDFKKNLAEKEALLSEARLLATDDDVIAAYRRLQDLHNKWRQIGPVAKEQREQIWNAFREASAEVNRRYQSYFEARKARESENEAAKTLLCERIEAIDITKLKSFAAWEKAADQIKAIQAEWHTLGFASKKANHQLYARFRNSCNIFFNAKNEFARNLRESFSNAIAAKQALVEEAEKLATSTDWRATADRLIEMQAEWRKAGVGPRRQSDQLWARFKNACDTFFEAKKEAGNDERNVENNNLKTKREIIGQLSALITDGADKKTALAELRKLQQRWRDTGHVPYREKEKIATAYREAVDAVMSHFDAADRGARKRRYAENIQKMQADGDKVFSERDRLMRIIENRRAELRTYENNLGFLSSRSKSGDSLVRDMERRINRLKADIDELIEKARMLDEKIK